MAACLLLQNVDSLTPTQTWDLSERSGETDEELFQATAFSKFQNVQSLVLYIPSNHGSDITRVLFFGVRGVSTADKRGIVKATYEARAMLADHKTEATQAPRMGM